ncbi:MAG: hypothetical protein N5P05_002475 [Chroococcopsis gigantea SAG 12.99]|jgi:transglutaminase-like putative cysteine protease|nr:hypothetical protein [Chroococcopsis gigantea SAG 12.99]
MPEYHIQHQTQYTYNQPVWLGAHLLRLRPRSDGWQTLQKFNLQVSPPPGGQSEIIDLDGNNALQIWFDKPIEQLMLHTSSIVETHIENPFNYIIDPWGAQLVIDYPDSLAGQLQPYLKPYGLAGDGIVTEIARDMLSQTDNNLLSFLSALNNSIYQHCQYVVRDTGEPWLPGRTWRDKQGSCRDFVVLFMDVCRTVGLATRFVSGYQEGDVDQDGRDLHAWVEVYIPGGGWRGYDPTLGLAVCDRHIALAASAIPKYCAPIVGNTTGLEKGKPIKSNLMAQIIINRVRE